uniref:NADH:ubiquinone reductase (H(+)-translocating) n=1 Tax=Ibalia leucospoides TaxID=32408 RepID=A0A0E3DQR5_9HYME|nr:NADH dehydrogenase subunit 5 [Ibalia leucospoides]AIK21705.1 NADH dehydrogenase subunit 5 [Ibalia leucospoides]
MINNLMMIQLLFLSSIFMILSMIFIMMKNIILIEWLIYSINSYNMKFIILIDWMMLIFLSVIMFISSMVMLYSKEYMKMELKKKYFIMILFLFVLSMILMVISPNIISIILGWDGLGLISYCLIIYYQNIYSFNSGMLTLLTNRIGDVMLLIMIFLIFNLGSWNLMFYKMSNKLLMILFLIMIMTKSAQIPFSMWLPAAMAAPTPVSSLVHSSTLVTAGIYLLIRYQKLFLFNNMNFMIMIIGMLTMIISSINAILDYDLKKIIAFSTLSQLGLMMMMLSIKLTNYVFFHLLSHAMFKSLLFLCSGVIIHFMNNMQDIRFMGNLIYETPLIIMYMNFSNLSLCGFPFLSGFYTKDLMYEMILNYNLNFYIYNLMYLCIMLTVMYSMRLMYYLIFNMNMFYSLSMKMDNWTMSISMFMLFLMSLIFSTFMNWLLFSSMNFSIINLNIKNILYFMMLIGLILINMKYFNYNLKMYFYTLIIKLMMFFYLLKITMLNNFMILMFSKSLMKINEFGWNEYYMKYLMKDFLNMINKNFYLFHLNKFIQMFMMFIYLYLILFMINW